MTSADIASRILNWQSASYVSSKILDDTPLSELVAQYRDAVLEEAADSLDKSRMGVIHDENEHEQITSDVAYIRALKGCS